MKIIASSKVYDQFANEYDNWFEKHSNLYQSELLAMKQVIPQNKIGIEIGVGTGRFAEPLGIKYGVEPSASMAELAKQRGIKVFNAIAENLPIETQSYDFATMVTTVCFLNNIPKAFAEVHRILKPGEDAGSHRTPDLPSSCTTLFDVAHGQVIAVSLSCRRAVHAV